MTDDPVDRTADHREAVRSLSGPGGALDPAGPHATTANPQWFFGRHIARPTPERERLHRQLLDETLAEHPGVAHQRRAIVLAGPPGAGKSTILREVVGADNSAWLLIDADEFKHKLLREALRDGSYEGFLKPSAVAESEAAGEPFYPLELASLVHEESSYLAAKLRDQALGQGANVIVDSVLSKPAKAVALGERLVRADYRVEVIDVEVPIEVSRLRIAHRWRVSYESAIASGEGLGGRWVPSEFARAVFDPESGRARSQEAARSLAESCPNVVRYRRFWTPEHDAAPVVEVDQSRRGAGTELVSTALLASATRGQRPQTSPRLSPPDPGRGLGR